MRQAHRYQSVIIWLFVLALGWPAGGLTVEQVMAEQVSPPTVAIDCPDVTVQDQQGHTVSFHQVTGDRVVLLTFTYGTCRTACPIVNGLFAAVHRQLGERVGRDVVFLSVTVDPERDRPEHLAIQHQQFGSPPHWYRLTGDRTDLARLWQAFGIRVGADPAAHTSDLFIGNPARGTWRRVTSLLSPQELLRVLDETTVAIVH